MNKINIAIDGPAGSGKSTVAKLVAQKLAYVYIDTGAMYRALTWKALQEKLNLDQETDLAELLKKITITIQPNETEQKIFVDEMDVTEEIRTPEVNKSVSIVASHAQVRQMMLNRQAKLTADKGVVMDGRDIGTHVLPQAEVKVYLYASIEERSRRRYLELLEKGFTPSLAELQDEIRERDERDMTRQVAPLEKACDAYEIDSTGLTIEEVVQIILNLALQKIK